jgi:hypothetical protein
MNITAKINLRQLKSHVMKMKSKSGENIDCIILPIEQNHLFKGEKGIYLDLQGYELKERREGQKDTHLVKQNLPKEVYDSMTDEEKNALPILGNMTVWGKTEPEPRNFEVYQPDPGEADQHEAKNDLPF